MTDTQQDAVSVRLKSIELGMARIETGLAQVIELSKSVALLQERGDHHKGETDAMGSRLGSQIADVEQSISLEQINREAAVKHAHGRIDQLTRWVWMATGGAAVVAALLVYGMDSAKMLVAEVVRVHDSDLKQNLEFEQMKGRIDRLEQSIKK